MSLTVAESKDHRDISRLGVYMKRLASRLTTEPMPFETVTAILGCTLNERQQRDTIDRLIMRGIAWRVGDGWVRGRLWNMAAERYGWHNHSEPQGDFRLSPRPGHPALTDQQTATLVRVLKLRMQDSVRRDGPNADQIVSGLVSEYNGQDGLTEERPVEERINSNFLFDLFEKEVGFTPYAYMRTLRDVAYEGRRLPDELARIVSGWTVEVSNRTPSLMLANRHALFVNADYAGNLNGDQLRFAIAHMAVLHRVEVEPPAGADVAVWRMAMSYAANSTLFSKAASEPLWKHAIRTPPKDILYDAAYDGKSVVFIYATILNSTMPIKVPLGEMTDEPAPDPLYQPIVAEPGAVVLTEDMQKSFFVVKEHMLLTAGVARETVRAHNARWIADLEETIGTLSPHAEAHIEPMREEIARVEAFDELVAA